jgi:hypothetical protein
MSKKKKNHAAEPSESSLFRASSILNRFTMVALLLGGFIGFFLSSFVNKAPDEPSLHQFIEKYFTTWSNKNMEAYAACFDPSATIYLIENSEVARQQNFKEFLEGQKIAHRAALYPLEEHAEDIDFFITGNMAYVRVLWKLTAGNRVSKGYDHFVISKTPAGWKIITLIFYGI